MLAEFHTRRARARYLLYSTVPCVHVRLLLTVRCIDCQIATLPGCRERPIGARRGGIRNRGCGGVRLELVPRVGPGVGSGRAGPRRPAATNRMRRCAIEQRDRERVSRGPAPSHRTSYGMRWPMPLPCSSIRVRVCAIPDAEARRIHSRARSTVPYPARPLRYHANSPRRSPLSVVH